MDEEKSRLPQRTGKPVWQEYDVLYKGLPSDDMKDVCGLSHGGKSSLAVIKGADLFPSKEQNH